MTLYNEILASKLPLDDHGALADALSVGRTRLQTRMIGIGAVLEALGPERGAALLDTLEGLSQANSVIKWAMHLLDKGELDVSLPSTRAQLDGMAQTGILSPDDAEAIKALAVVPDVITSQMVSAAMEGR